ncbi:flagellar motor protein MotB [Dongia soli]|uniref:Flagellar motor protein MotB n=1 Tax=Dongia soli TaxID=600628 RepID=A0ABU5EAR1_9PROT|nr:flagellar motor protein MotB [Dongia soli]MDY0882665.1 flagellar motor protein MotB [Dongia soli]
MIRVVNIKKDDAHLPDGHQPLWLITFADLIGLLLVFFVLLFSMSSLERSQLQHLTQGVTGIQGTDEADAPNRPLPDPQVQAGRDPGYLTSVLRAKFDMEPALRSLTVTDFGDRSIIALTPENLNQAIGLNAKPGQSNILYTLAGVLRMLPNQIIVDSRLIDVDKSSSAASGTDWEKSLRVALIVGKALADGGLGAPVTVRSHVVTNGEPAGVDIVLLETTMPADDSQAQTKTGSEAAGGAEP